MPGFSLGSAEAALVVIEDGESGLGEQFRVVVDMRFHAPEAGTHHDPGMSARAGGVQVCPQDEAVFGWDLCSSHDDSLSTPWRGCVALLLPGEPRLR